MPRAASMAQFHPHTGPSWWMVYFMMSRDFDWNLDKLDTALWGMDSSWHLSFGRHPVARLEKKFRFLFLILLEQLVKDSSPLQKGKAGAGEECKICLWSKQSNYYVKIILSLTASSFLVCWQERKDSVGTQFCSNNCCLCFPGVFIHKSGIYQIKRNLWVPAPVSCLVLKPLSGFPSHCLSEPSYFCLARNIKGC